MARSSATGRSISSGAYRTAVIGDGATFYWRCGYTYGQFSNLIDTDVGVKGVDFTGNITGAGCSLQTGAIKNDSDKSFLFNNGTDRNYIARQSAILLTSAPWSIEMWVKPVSGAQTSRQYLLVQDFGGSTGAESITWGMLLEANTLTPMFYTRPSGYKYVTNGSVTNNAWNHLVGTLSSDGKTMKLYINGSLTGSLNDGSTLTPQAANITNWLLFGTGGGGNRYFFGYGDEIAVYQGVELTAAQVATHYAIGVNGFQRPTVSRSTAASGRSAA